MNSKKSITYLVIIIILLTICSAASIGYIIGNSNSVSNLDNNNPSSIPNDNLILNPEIDKLKFAYNSKIAEKTATYNELEIEKEKVQELFLELEKVKGDANSLLKYKNHYKNLEEKMLILVDEINALRNNKVKAVSKVIASKRVKSNTKTTVVNANPKPIVTNSAPIISQKELIPTKTEPLVLSNELIKKEFIPEKKIAKEAAELSVTNLETAGYRSRSSTNNEITSIANKVDYIKISFTVTGNSNAIAEEKKYYIQVINSKNNVLGAKTTESMDGKTLSYSMSRTIQFEGQNIPVVYDLIDSKFEKGIYFVTIFERSKLVAKTKFTLN